MKSSFRKFIAAALIMVMAVVFMPVLKADTAYAETYNPDKYTPGPNLAVSKFQSKFKVDVSYLKTSDGMDQRVLAIKKSKSLWDVTRNKKITSYVKDMVSLENEGSEPGVLVLKTSGNLYYMWKKSTGSWGSKKLLSDVKEFADEPVRVSYTSGTSCKYFVYLVKKDGRFMKGTVLTNSKGTKVKKSSWIKLLGGVNHGYVCYGYDSDYNTTRCLWAIKKDGSLYAWGSNSQGETGNGKTKKVSDPRLVMKNVKQFCWSNRAGQTYGTACYAVKENGDLYVWGCGDALPADILTGTDTFIKPIKIMTNVRMVDGNSWNTNVIALTKDGILWTWGHEAGKTAYNYYDNITKVSDKVIAAESDGSAILFIKKNNTLWYLGFPPGESYKKCTKTPIRIAYNATAVNSPEYMGTYVLKTDGDMYGTDYYYKKQYKKLHKMGTGYPN